MSENVFAGDSRVFFMLIERFMRAGLFRPDGIFFCLGPAKCDGVRIGRAFGRHFCGGLSALI